MEKVSTLVYYYGLKKKVVVVPESTEDFEKGLKIQCKNKIHSGDYTHNLLALPVHPAEPTSWQPSDLTTA